MPLTSGVKNRMINFYYCLGRYKNRQSLRAHLKYCPAKIVYTFYPEIWEDYHERLMSIRRKKEYYGLG